MTVPDINKIASAVAVELTKSFGSAIIKEVPKQIKRQMSYIFPQFKSYLEETYDKCANVKTIINKDRSFGIEEIYVPGTFKFDEEIISDQDVMQMIRDMHPTVVVGFGGIGKTVFTKQLWCSIFAEPGGKIPVFLELRRLNRITDIDLTTYIRISMTNGDEIFDERMFQSFLASGSFVFIFDGFDELLDSKKEKIAQEKLDMAGKYRENGIVVSSRYLDTFNSWQRFRIVRAQHFSRKQTEMLLEKVPYDRRTKKVFKKEIIDSKYQ